MISIGLLAIVGLAVLAALAVIGMLLASPDTRGAGLAFLGAGGVLVLLLVLFGSLTYVNVVHKEQTEAAQIRNVARDLMHDPHVDDHVATNQHIDHSHNSSQSMEHVHDERDAHGGVLHGEIEGVSSSEFDYAPEAAEAHTRVGAALDHSASRELPTGEVVLHRMILIVPVVAIALIAFAFMRGDASLWPSVLGLVGGAVVVGLCAVWWWAGKPSSVHRDTMPQPLASVASDTAEAWDFATAPRIVVELDEPADEKTPAEPGDKPNKPAKPERPEWVDQELFRSGNVVRRTVSAGPFATLEECEQELLSKIDDAVCRQVKTLTGTQPAGLSSIDVTQPYVMSECLVDQYAEQSKTKTGFEVWNQHVLLEFTPTVDNYLLNQFYTSQRYDRVSKVAMGGGGVLGLLAVVLGMLRLDTATKGYYTKRLFIGVPVAIIGALGLLAWIA